VCLYKERGKQYFFLLTWVSLISPISLLRSNSIDSPFLFQKPAQDRDVMKEVAKTHEAIQYVGMNTGNGFFIY
jgi:hypothetical protein